MLQEQKEKGSQRAEDFNLIVVNVGLVLDTILSSSLYIQLAIEALEIMHMWVDIFGSRDVSAIISCEGTTLAELRVEFLKKGFEAASCLNLTTSR